MSEEVSKKNGGAGVVEMMSWDQSAYRGWGRRWKEWTINSESRHP